MLNQFFFWSFNHTVPPLTSQPQAPMNPYPLSFLCTVGEVTDLLLSVNIKKATRPDEVSGRMLKVSAHTIAPSLTRLLNLSLTTGKLPNEWKSSNIFPVPKSCDKSFPAGFRPISLLCIISKLLGKHVYEIMLHHACNHSLIPQNQWGFLARRSTETALIKVTSDWLQDLEMGSAVCVIFLDLSKAFDSVPIRCYSPDCNMIMGFNEHLLFWLHNYLYQQRQRVTITGCSSAWSML